MTSEHDTPHEAVLDLLSTNPRQPTNERYLAHLAKNRYGFNPETTRGILDELKHEGLADHDTANRWWATPEGGD